MTYTVPNSTIKPSDVYTAFPACVKVLESEEVVPVAFRPPKTGEYFLGGDSLGHGVICVAGEDWGPLSPRLIVVKGLERWWE